MGIFTEKYKGIGTAHGTEGGNYLPAPGNYIVKVERCKTGETRTGNDFFVAELRILESNNEEMKVGMSANIFIKVRPEFPQLAVGNIADFGRAGVKAFAVQHDMDPNEAEFSAEVADEIVNENNILVGTIMKVEAYNKNTKEGNPFTHYKYDDITKAEMKPYL